MPTIHPNDPDSLKPVKGARRSRGEDPVPAPSHKMNAVPDDYRRINGWGADLDPKNRPSYPKELPSDVTNVRGKVGARQIPRETVHVSNEHPDLTPVFGVTCPPKGLSGVLRSYAYEYGEATNRHWLTLMLADRIDVIESLITGVLQGKPDHYLDEKAWNQKLKHPTEGRNGRYALIGAALLGAAGLALAVRRIARDRD